MANNTPIQSEEDSTLPDKPKGSQYSEKALQELIRPMIPELITKAIDIAKNCKNENVQLGAIKLLMGKVLPDLKAQEIKSDGISLRVIIEDYGSENNTTTKAEGSNKGE